MYISSEARSTPLVVIYFSLFVKIFSLSNFSEASGATATKYAPDHINN